MPLSVKDKIRCRASVRASACPGARGAEARFTVRKHVAIVTRQRLATAS
jgi:hypothetical protein